MSPGPNPPLQLSDAGRALVARLLGEIPADEATVWLFQAEDATLKAVHNPVNAKIIGLEQPISSGLISQVLATGLPLLEPDVSKGTGHDDSINKQTDQETHGLMAAPIYLEADTIGVLSAVQLVGGSQSRAFGSDDLAKLERAARELGPLMGQASA